MLIVEGPDTVGKSELCRRLIKLWTDNPRKYSPWPVIYQQLSKLPESWHHYKSYLPYINRLTVQDRFHLSELVYGRVCRKEPTSRLSPTYLRLIEARLALVGSYTLVVTASPEVLKANWKKLDCGGKREEMFKLDQVLEVNKAYEAMVAGDDSEWTESRIDFHYRMEELDGWISNREDLMDQMLRTWSSRLGSLYAAEINGDAFYGPPNPEAEPVRGLR